MTLRGQIYAQSETFMRQFNLDPFDKQDGFTKTDVTFRFETADGKWNVFGGVENIEDEDVVSNIDVNPTGSLLRQPSSAPHLVPGRWL